MTRLVNIVLFGLVVAILIFIGWPYYLKYNTHRNSSSHTIEHTRQDLRNLTLGLLILCELERKQFGAVREGEQSLTGKQIYKQVSQSQEALNTSRPSEASVFRGTFCDRWDKEIHGTLNTVGGKLFITLWSDGPNLQNEAGDGDDILEKVEIQIHEERK